MKRENSETSDELYEAFIKLLNSHDLTTRYQILIAMFGFDYEMPDFIDEAEKRLLIEKDGSIRNLLKDFIERAKRQRDEGDN